MNNIEINSPPSDNIIRMNADHAIEFMVGRSNTFNSIIMGHQAGKNIMVNDMDKLNPLILGYQAAQQAMHNNIGKSGAGNLMASNLFSIGYQAAQEALQNNVIGPESQGNLTTSDLFALGYQAGQQAAQNNVSGFLANGSLTVSDFCALGHQAAQKAVQNNVSGNGATGTLMVSNLFALGYQAAQLAVQNNIARFMAKGTLMVRALLALGCQAAQYACTLSNGLLTANGLVALGYQAAQYFNNNILNGTINANDVVAIGTQAAGNCNNSLAAIEGTVHSNDLIAIGNCAAQNQNAKCNAVNISAVNNIAIGQQALQNNNYNNYSFTADSKFQADHNIAIGYQALINNNNNISVASNNVVSNGNIAIGYQANQYFGSNTLNITNIIPYGNDNIIIGNSSTIQTVNGLPNTGQSLSTIECNRNIIIGKDSSFDPSYFDNSQTNRTVKNTNDYIIIGNNLNINGTIINNERLDQPGTFIANINNTNFGTYTISGNNSVKIIAINADHRLGYVSLQNDPDSRHFKEEIRPLEITDLAVRFQRLQPVSFVHRLDRTQRYGLVAEDILEIFPECIECGQDTRTGEQSSCSIRYNGIIALLVKRVQEQELEIQNLKRVIQEQEDLRTKLNTLEEKMAKLFKIG